MDEKITGFHELQRWKLMRCVALEGSNEYVALDGIKGIGQNCLGNWLSFGVLSVVFWTL